MLDPELIDSLAVEQTGSRIQICRVWIHLLHSNLICVFALRRFAALPVSVVVAYFLCPYFYAPELIPGVFVRIFRSFRFFQVGSKMLPGLHVWRGGVVACPS